MKNLYRMLTAIVGLCTVSIAGAQTADYAQHELLVKFRTGVGSGTISNTHRQAHAVVLDVIPHINVQHIQLPDNLSVQDALNYYRSLATVAYAEPNYREHLLFTPNDPQFTTQWGMAKIHAPEAWDLGRGASGVVTAVIDTGVDLQHEDLKNKLVAGYDFSDNDPDPTYSDPHGVHTAGIVGAQTNNGKGVAGVSFNCMIMPLKIFPNAYDTTSAQAIIYAADHGAKVVSMSYGAYAFSQTEKDATDYAWTHGVLLVAAAGNDNTTNLMYPGSLPRVLCVGSTNQSDQKSGFSNFGSDHVSVAAPGENILSTFPNNTYAAIDGTSMACPHVAGLGALLFSYAPSGTTNLQIRNAIEQTTDPVGNWVKNGRVNAFHAMQRFTVAAEINYAPIDIQPYIGDNPSGTLASITAPDSLYYSISSVPVTTGQMGGDIVTLAVTDDVSNLRSAKLLLAANAPAGTSNQVYLWNFGTAQWEISRASALRSSGINQVSLNLPNNLSAYVQDGQMRVLTRAIMPNRPLRGQSGAAQVFTYDLNYIQLKVRP